MKKVLLLLAVMLGGLGSVNATETTIWEDTPIAIDWSSNVIVVAKDKFASANVGDVIHITVDAVSGGYPQVIVCVPAVGTDLEGAKHLDAAGVVDITMTGDILNVAKVLGLQFKGDGMTVSKITLESDVYTGRPSDAIWVGEEGTVTISREHFNRAAVSAGDIIQATYTTQGTWSQLLPSQKGPDDYSWGDPYALTKTEADNKIQFVVDEDLATNAYDVILQSDGYTFTSVQIIKADMTAPSTIWTGTQEYKTWTGFNLAASNFVSAKVGYILRFTVSELYDVDATSWTWGGKIYIKNPDGWADLSPAFESNNVPISTEVPMTIDMVLRQDVIDLAQVSGVVVGGMGLTITKIELVPVASITFPAGKDYVSFCSSSALDFTGIDGLTAYIVSAVGASAATLTEVTQVPAGTGLILKGTAGTTYQVPVIASASAIGTNYLQAALTATAVAANSTYVLFDGKLKTFTGTSIPAGKAYLNISGAARDLDLNFGGETTGINEELRMKNEESVYYNIAGQRVAQPTKGLYIVNGKKVIIK